MVRHPVHDECHAAGVAFTHQQLEVVDGAEFGIDRRVIGYAVGGILALNLPDRVDGHDPDHVGAQAPDGVELRNHRKERGAVGEYAGIHLIHYHLFGNRHDIFRLGFGLGLAGNQGKGRGKYWEQLFHMLVKFEYD